jgi:hypothetical protein
MNTPASSAGQNLQRAKLVIESPKVADNVIDFRFKPDRIPAAESNSFSEIPIPGLESPPIQFVRGNSEKTHGRITRRYF